MVNSTEHLLVQSYFLHLAFSLPPCKNPNPFTPHVKLSIEDLKMAEEEAVTVTLEAPSDHHHKRKIDDLEPTPHPHAPDVAAPDSTLVLDGDRKGENENDEEASEQKRPRLDEMPDGLASENGHKAEEDKENGVANAETSVVNAETTESVKDTETIVNDQVGSDEQPSEVLPGEANDVQPVAEGEQNVDPQDDNSEAKDVQIPPKNDQSENAEKPAGDELTETATEVKELGNDAPDQHHPELGSRTVSRKIEIPNNKVGVLIGKGGDTIKYLQINSGAKIQITRDADADPRAATRPVELVGTLESFLNKAERLIKDVIAEADAGGSPSLVARGFNAAMTAGSVEIEIHVPSDKVGLIIGKGGETIRSLQTRSGARIQLIPQSDQSKEKKVKVTGDKKQVEMARELIKEVMIQIGRMDD